MRASSRALRAALHLASAAALTAVAAARADAQLCAAASFETYLADGFSCTLGGFRFGDFIYLNDPTASGSGLAFIPDPGAVTVTPFTGIGAGGRATFGFSFVNFATAASVGGGGAGPGEAAASLAVGFLATGLHPAAALSRASFSLALTGVTGTPALAEVGAEASALVFGGAPPSVCIDDGQTLSGAGTRTATLAAGCAPGRPNEFVTILVTRTTASRGADPGTGTGSARAEIAAVTFTAAQVVPEPATVVLFGAGLLGAGLVARRRTA